MSPYVPKTMLEYTTAVKNYLIARASRLSNFNPGSRVLALIEGIAAELAMGDVEMLHGWKYYALNFIYVAFGFARKAGTVSVGTLRFENTGHTDPFPIPIVTIDLYGQKFETVEATSIPVGQTYVVVEARAKEIGLEGNITLAAIDTADGRGTISPSLTVNRVWNPSAFSGGTDFESDQSRAARFKEFVGSLGRSTVSGIRAGALKVQGVAGAVVKNKWNPFTNETETGWVSVYISDGTSSPSLALIEEVRRTIEGDETDEASYPGYVAAGVNVYVGAVQVMGISFSYSMQVLAGSPLSDDEAKAFAEGGAIAYINSLPVGQDVRVEMLNARMTLAHPDIFDIDLSIVSNITVPSESLPRIGGTSGGVITCTGVTRVVPT